MLYICYLSYIYVILYYIILYYIISYHLIYYYILHTPIQLHTPTPIHMYNKELQVAVAAVRRASLLAKKIQQQVIAHRTETTITKSDNSPVTVGDYAAQTIIINAIRANFPHDPVVGEESAQALSDHFLTTILKEIDKNHHDDDDDSSIALTNDKFPLQSINDVRQIINFGDYKGGDKGRFWCLDPIDGTKGFLRGQQFAVCLALIVDGVVQVGVIGCPNLNLSSYKVEPILSSPNSSSSSSSSSSKSSSPDNDSFGYIFKAVRGHGAAYATTANPTHWKPTHVRRHLQSTSNMVALEGVEKSHSSHDEQSRIKKSLNINKSIHIDSQVKYCLLALGVADVYLRLPINLNYQEKIWDHAAGNVILQESGGIHTDSMQNKQLDFSKGRTLLTKGVIATSGPKPLHDLVVHTANTVIASNV